MGFSVSGSAAIIFASMFIAFGMWYTATANSVERVNDAQGDRTDRALEQQNTALEIVEATYNASGEDKLRLAINNTGAATLRLSSTDLLVDGDYETGWRSVAAVDGNDRTDLWHGSEQLSIERSPTNEPVRVKVVTGTGVADTAEVNASG